MGGLAYGTQRESAAAPRSSVPAPCFLAVTPIDAVRPEPPSAVGPLVEGPQVAGLVRLADDDGCLWVKPANLCSPEQLSYIGDLAGDLFAGRIREDHTHLRAAWHTLPEHAEPGLLWGSLSPWPMPAHAERRRAADEGLPALVPVWVVCPRCEQSRNCHSAALLSLVHLDLQSGYWQQDHDRHM